MVLTGWKSSSSKQKKAGKNTTAHASVEGRQLRDGCLGGVGPMRVTLGHSQLFSREANILGGSAALCSAAVGSVVGDDRKHSTS